MNPIFILIAALLIVSAPGFSQTPKHKVRINHTAIYVRDLSATKHFYEDIIGLDTIPEPFHDGKHVWYSIGPGVSMHVIEGASEVRSYYKNQHTCFSVGSVESFIALLRKSGITFEDVAGKKNSVTTRVDGVKQIWLQDPDGYWIEINDAKD